MNVKYANDPEYQPYYELAKKNGISASTFYHRVFSLKWDKKKAATKKSKKRLTPEELQQKEFAMYKGEKLLAIGTIKEIAEELGISHKTVIWYLYRDEKKRYKSNEHTVLIELDDEEDE